MVARATFKPNSKGIGQMLTSQKMEREMVWRARIVVGNAEVIAPRETGEYAASFDVESGRDKSPIRMGRGDRAWAKAKNTSGHAAAVEFGNKQVGEGQRVLGRAADQVTSG
jgi:hypothetical protein